MGANNTKQAQAPPRAVPPQEVSPVVHAPQSVQDDHDYSTCSEHSHSVPEHREHYTWQLERIEEARQRAIKQARERAIEAARRERDREAREERAREARRRKAKEARQELSKNKEIMKIITQARDKYEKESSYSDPEFKVRFEARKARAAELQKTSSDAYARNIFEEENCARRFRELKCDIRTDRVPTYKEFYKKTLRKFGHGYEFPVYWAICHHYGVPGFPNPNVVHEEYDEYAEYGAFDTKSLQATIPIINGLECHPELKYYLGDELHGRYPAVCKNYLSRPDGDYGSMNDYVPCHYMMKTLWPEYHNVVFDQKRKKKLSKIIEGKPVPDRIKMLVTENEYPKRLVGVKAFIVWDYYGQSSDDPRDTEEYAEKLNVVKQQIKDGDIEIPGFSKHEIVIVAAYTNYNWTRSIPGLDHYFIFIKNPGQKTHHETEEEPGPDEPSSIRRLLLSSNEHGA